MNFLYTLQEGRLKENSWKLSFVVAIARNQYGQMGRQVRLLISGIQITFAWKNFLHKSQILQQVSEIFKFFSIQWNPNNYNM